MNSFRNLLFFMMSFFIVLCSSNAHAFLTLYSDDFESGTGNWSNVSSGDNRDWLRDSNGTPSSKTGPVTGASGSTYYMYLETSSGAAYNAGDTAILEGPEMSDTNILLKFQYHMYGSNIGTLSVDILSDGLWINDVWSVSGQQQYSNSESYFPVDLDLSAYVISKVRFRATAVGGYMGDIAIDDIELLYSPSGPVAPVFLDDPLVKSAATQDQPYSGNLVADASDANGDVLTFTKTSGPEWLTIAANGDISGTPDSSNAGENSFTVEVTDGDLSGSTTMLITVNDDTTPIVFEYDDFESGFGGWKNVSTGDSHDWSRDSGGTPSTNTGPFTGANGSTYYVYLETSSGFAYYAGDTAILEGPDISAADVHLKFQYHMYGANIGTLAVDVLTNGIWTNDVWSVSGQQHPANSSDYTEVDIDLSSYSVSQVRLRATAIGWYLGDIAIDNLEISAILPVDSDGDGIYDIYDAFPDDADESVDTDNDGIGNNADTDDDNDGVPDIDDDLPLDSSETIDTDNDGIGNIADTDDDGDGVNDTDDAFPLDVNESVDTDGDGIGNNTDTDDDNDGVPDVNDDLPLDSSESIDTDSDGIGNNTDLDDDGDGVNDTGDAFPLDVNESVDTDGDGIGNNTDTDDDNDGVPDVTDDLPLDSSESIDTDNDGIGNNADIDDDGDGVNDINDAFPLNPYESIDTDGDGIGNNTDADDDNDGVTDLNDSFPLDNSESVDTDSDGIGNNADTDDDGDGIDDIHDDFPLDNSETIDTDNDGIGNNADTDDDGDGLSDADEINVHGTEPLSTDSDNDGMPDGWEVLHHLSPTVDDSNADNDGDGTINIDEFNSGTDPAPPVIETTSPMDSDIDIPVAATVSVTFSEEIDPATVTTSTFTISDGANTITGNLSVDSDGVTAVFTPDEALIYNTEYTATISEDITDLSGNATGSDYVWTFATVNSYFISGQITLSGQGLEGVTLSVSGGSPQSQTSDNDGYFTVNNLESGNYTVTASLSGYSFTPESVNIELTDNDVQYMDFVAMTIPAINVPADYLTVQEAVDAAAEGGTIIVGDGVYNENVIINKAITIESVNGYESTSVVAANNGQHVFTVNSANVTIKGFNISGAHNYYLAGIYFGAGSDNGKAINNRCGYDDAYRNYIGIYVVDSDYMDISNNICNHWGLFGMYVDQSSNSDFVGNTIDAHPYEGLYLKNISSCNISDNVVSNCRTGIELRYSDNNTISGNNTSSNTEHGIHVYDSGAGNAIIGNSTDSSAEVGIYVESSGPSTVSDNTVNNSGISGIVIYSSDTSYISGNTSNSSDDYGLYINSSDGCKVISNITKYNHTGIKLNYADNCEITTNESGYNDWYNIEMNQSTGNLVTKNVTSTKLTASRGYGIYYRGGSGNINFLNTFSGSDYGTSSVRSDNNATNIWVSPDEVTYTYNGMTFTGYIGNYYSEHTLTDSNGDGITDSDMDLPEAEPDGEFPMAAPLDSYELL